MTAMRSSRVFGHHAQALGAEDLEELVADYSNDAIFITPAGVQCGKDGIHQAFAKLLGEVPQATCDIRPPSTRTTSCHWSGAPRAATIVSGTASIPSPSATASSGSRPSRYTLQSAP